MMKLLSVLTLLTILNGSGISSTFKMNETIILTAEFDSLVSQQARNCPVYRRCKEVGGSH